MAPLGKKKLTTKIVAISDLHGQLPEIPECNLLLIAGDLCPVYDHSVLFQERWLKDNFYPWLRSLQRTGIVEYIVYVAGNHDFIFEREPFRLAPLTGIEKIYYLEESSVTVDGLKIYGLPDQLPFGEWAFNTSEADLKDKYSRIPQDVDVLISHGPPYGFGDRSLDWHGTKKLVNNGSLSLRERIDDLQPRPRLVVYGHIHEGYGRYQLGDSILLNASLMNEHYKLVNAPLEVTLK